MPIPQRNVLRLAALTALWCGLLAMPLISLADDVPLQVVPTQGKPGLSGGNPTSNILGLAPDPAGDPLANEVIECNGCVAAPQAGVVLWQQCPVGGSPVCSATWFISGPCNTTVNGEPSAQVACNSVDANTGSAQLPQVPAPTITVDGVSLAQDAYRSKALSLAHASAPTTDSHLVLEQAAAVLVLNHLLLVEAARDGIAATPADGRAIALKIFDIYTSEHINDPAVPKSDPQGYFLSADRIAGYQMGETLRRARGRVLAGVDLSNPTAVRIAFADWLRAALQRHLVVVTGGAVPSNLSLPDFVPEGL